MLEANEDAPDNQRTRNGKYGYQSRPLSRAALQLKSAWLGYPLNIAGVRGARDSPRLCPGSGILGNLQGKGNACMIFPLSGSYAVVCKWGLPNHGPAIPSYQ